MRAFIAFLKKELLEAWRSGKLLILGIIFVALGVMNPAIAKITPMLLDLFAEELGGSGIEIGTVTADALASWAQFFKNIPMAIIAFVCIYTGSFTKEYGRGTLILVLTKGLARYKVVLAKASVMLSLWSIGYWVCYFITYVINAAIWDNSTVAGFLPAAVNWWLFGLFAVALMVLFSVISGNYGFVMLGVGGSVLAIYVISLVPKLSKAVPTSLMNSSGLLLGMEQAGDYLPAIIVTAVLTVGCIVASVPIMNKKQL